MPARILFAIGSMEVGGAEKQVIRYLRHLDRTRFLPGLYLIDRRGELLADVPEDVPIYAFGERVRPSKLYVPGGIHRRQVQDLTSVIREFGADLVVGRSFHMTLIAAPAAKRRSIPLIAIEASNPQWDFQRSAGRFQSIKRRLISRAYASAAAVVALSEGAARGLSEFYRLPEHRVRRLSSSIDLGELKRLAAEPAPPLEPGCFHMASVGRLVPEKGHRDLIEAVARLIGDGERADLRLHVIGDGPLRVELERFAHERGIGSAVHFAGFRRNPIAIVRQCDLFCLPSHYEGMPGALLEAMSCGVPVIACDCESGPREIFDGGRFGTLIPVGDPTALAAAILDVANKPAAARDKAFAGQRHVEQKYSASAVVEQMQALFQEVLRR